MERPAQAVSETKSGLLCRQLDSITRTLAKASQRRDAEVEKRQIRNQTTIPIASELSVTCNTDVSQASDSYSGYAELVGISHTETDQLSTSPIIVPRKRSILTPPLRMSSINSCTTLQQQEQRLSLRGGYDAPMEGDFKKMLADLDRSHLESAMNVSNKIKLDESRNLTPAKLGEWPLSSGRTAFGDGARAMLAELDQQRQYRLRSAGKHDDGGPCALQDRQATVNSLSHNAENDRTREPNMSSGLQTASLQDDDVPYQAHQNTIAGLDQNLIPLAVALYLETAAFGWHQIAGWTKYLFSAGYRVQQQYINIASTKLAMEKTDVLVNEKRQQEMPHCKTVNSERPPCRLVVCNLAADAGEEEVRAFFHQFKLDICNVTLLAERHPVRRTRTAHVDMRTKIAAIKASYLMGSIFGLYPDVQLAVEKKEKSR